MNYKHNEIKEYFINYLTENSEYINCILDNDDIYDLHHKAFNTDYYIIGTYKATQWLGDEVFNIINFIKEYEVDNFGEVNTDFSNPEKIVTMYVYIIGEQLVSELHNLKFTDLCHNNVQDMISHLNDFKEVA
tara:strand:+ start:122 stop:517 length:396 start_codon:yes stop_codon:yes gene_type:complete